LENVFPCISPTGSKLTTLLHPLRRSRTLVIMPPYPTALFLNRWEPVEWVLLTAT
jgi:hypothetical protein